MLFNKLEYFLEDQFHLLIFFYFIISHWKMKE